MFPETLLTLICTLEKSGSCADATPFPSMAIADIARIISIGTILRMFLLREARRIVPLAERKRSEEKPLAPGGQGPAGKQSFGGPLTEIHRERDAVTVESGEDHHILGERVAAKNEAHAWRKQNWARPAVRDAHGPERCMQMMHAMFQPTKTLRGFSFAHIEAVQIRRGVARRAVPGALPKQRGDRGWRRNQAC